MNQDIINWLITYPNTENVYLNEGGEWSFHPRQGFDKVISRAEALAQPKESTETKEIKEKPSKNK